MDTSTREQVAEQQTQHALLVAWGWFAQEIGLLEQLQQVPLHQKRYHHRPQGKVLEFLVAILAGLKHLQEISLAAHPLDKDRAVAQAWGQAGWADYSGVSRTLRGLSWEEVNALIQGLEAVSRPYLTCELQRLQSSGQRLCYDGDLTGLPVSNTSQSYPNAAFGYMDDAIRLGYQAGLVSLRSPTYGRLWLAIAHHPGDTVSCTQASNLVYAAEAKTSLRPLRRTALLRQRLAALEEQLCQTNQRHTVQQQAVQGAQERWCESQREQQQRQEQLNQLEGEYHRQERQERPTSRLALARQRWQATTQRLTRREQACQAAQRRLDKTTACAEQLQALRTTLAQRLACFEADNATNATPVTAEFRLDAGFGTYDNIALLCEMGYEVYTKPHSHRVVTALRQQVDEHTAWVRVGANAELVAWPQRRLQRCPYPLDVALERFYTGKTCKHSALLHFGSDAVTADLVAWFTHYNARQTIEAGIKECKHVFYLHHLKVRTEPAIYLQEAFVIFAANFIRWAAHWLAAHTPADEHAFDLRSCGVKRQVQVAAHVSAQVTYDSEGKLLTFSEQSALAGQFLRLPVNHLLPAPDIVF